MSPHPRVWIGLGGNVGDVAGHLAAARVGLAALAEGALTCSALYETAPWGPIPQPPFINQVVGLDTQLDPPRLLEALLAIEAGRGRTREIRWGQRTLDMDILAWRGLRWRAPSLIIPHPRLEARRFVLAPWAEVAADFTFGGRSVAARLAACPDASWARRCSG
ncbi:2-amino-4-hydroxy-6-hydroxymethyldihydropteridine diphosphokinase [Myxococcota bacterium]|nr:2-amino-4-hydroxy-6-hydroxymethyldihydropteridine diphosphokinase [Myxococcota bacterium]MBU1431613.1 2-amino-4-hydroxy-6-hydroxymethyldihydropteridine diphosphokinase [Myxococcota bacterium]MBU1898695.1 2-amino-4-hydroxy-6-hydroxymethyldihydropteridine diphosphokinase [Myxococcota bacterium]